jgi:ribosomal protein L11 methyltransferase
VIRLALAVRRSHAELALAELLELAPSGVEEVDVSADVVEYVVYDSAADCGYGRLGSRRPTPSLTW